MLVVNLNYLANLRLKWLLTAVEVLVEYNLDPRMSQSLQQKMGQNKNFETVLEGVLDGEVVLLVGDPLQFSLHVSIQ